MNLIIWMNIPSHHQSQFFDSIYRKNPELKVHYYQEVFTEREEMGWSATFNLKDYESFVDPNTYTLDTQELKNYIHIILGYSHKFTRKLRDFFCQNNITWVHWSEKATPGWKWYLSFPRKRLHAHYVNKYALGAFAISEYAKNDFIKWGMEPNKIEILPYSFNQLSDCVADFRILEFKKKRRAFLFVGSLYHLKGTDILLNAFAIEFKDNPHWCLILVGNQKNNVDYRKMVKKLGIEHQVLFRGVVESKNIKSVYEACDVFVLPSRYDGWGMVASEAIYSGMPVIVSDAAGCSRHIVHLNKNGHTFRSGDYQSLAEVMILYKDENTIVEYGKYSSLLFNRFNSEYMSSHFLKTLSMWLSYNENIS